MFQMNLQLFGGRGGSGGVGGGPQYEERSNEHLTSNDMDKRIQFSLLNGHFDSLSRSLASIASTLMSEGYLDVDVGRYESNSTVIFNDYGEVGSDYPGWTMRITPNGEMGTKSNGRIEVPVYVEVFKPRARKPIAVVPMNVDYYSGRVSVPGHSGGYLQDTREVNPTWSLTPSKKYYKAQERMERQKAKKK